VSHDLRRAALGTSDGGCASGQRLGDDDPELLDRGAQQRVAGAIEVA
jgi:hypothetical protein